jgi:peptidoglycan/LPS O-acetylase OafA/YrhL
VALFHTVIVTNAAANPKNILRLEHRVTSYLGRISYGIYVYQILAIHLSLMVVLYCFKSSDGVRGSMCYYMLSAALTLIFSAVSYRWFELPFLRLKPKYSSVLTSS